MIIKEQKSICKTSEILIFSNKKSKDIRFISVNHNEYYIYIYIYIYI